MSERVLIVDDEEDIGSMLQRHFRFEGYEVDTAICGDEALEALEKTNYDIVISDIMMPGMTGIELLKIVRRDFPFVKMIMMTGFVKLEFALEALKLGAETMVLKPFPDLVELEQAVTRAMEHSKMWKAKLKGLQALKDKEGQNV